MKTEILWKTEPEPINKKTEPIIGLSTGLSSPTFDLDTLGYFYAQTYKRLANDWNKMR